MSEDKVIQFNPSMGKRGPLWGVLHVDLILKMGLPLGLAIIAWMMLQSSGINIPPQWLIAPAVAWCGTEWVLSGERPWAYWGKFIKGKRRVRAGLKFRPAKNQLKPRPGPVAIRKKRHHAVENLSDLGSHVEFRLKGRKIGAYLLQKGDELKVTFAFKYLGFGTCISPEESLEIATNVQEGLKTLTTTESVTFEAITRSDCLDRVQSLQKLINKGLSPELEYLLKWDQQRAKSLKRVNRHNPKNLTIFYTFTIGSTDGRQDSPIEEVLAWLEAKGKEVKATFSKPDARAFRRRVESVLRSAFHKGYGDAEEYLSEILGLPIEPMQAQQIWAHDWARFNNTPAPPVPHLLVLTKNGLKVKGLGNVHAASMLHPAAPIEHKTNVFLPGRQKYVGVAVLESKPARQWLEKDPAERLSQLLFGSNPLNDRKVFDTTITVQFSGQNQRYAISNVEGLAKAGNRDLKEAEDRRRVDQNAEHKLKKALSAGRILREGGVAAKCAVVAQVERDSIEELDAAMMTYCNRPEYGGGIMKRELEYTDKIFYQCLPTSWTKLLKSPFDRRLEDTTHALMSFIPLLIDRMPDSDGVQFVTQQGFTPVYLNPFCKEPHNHCITAAKTGGGKSVGIIGSIVQALALGGAVIIVDAGRADGSGSFSPIAKFLNGSYYNVLEDSYNLFEGTDFRKLSGYTNHGKEESARAIAQKTFKKFLHNALIALTIGEDKTQFKLETYPKILSLLIDSFLANEWIQSLYDAAFDGGFGSEAWQKKPTLTHFADYLHMENLPETIHSPDVERALREMRLALQALLGLPVGQAISRPSTFRSQSKLTVVAMGGLSDNAEAMPLSLAAASFVLSSSMANDRTLFIGDESSYLANFKAYMQIVASFFSGGRKMGVWCHLLLQSFKNLSESPHCADILDNTTTYFVGGTTNDVREFLVKRGVPAHLLKKSRKRDRPRFYDALTSWVYSQPEEGNHCKVFYPPSFGMLALAVNGPEEVPIREQFEAQFPGDKYAANHAFATYLRDNSREALEDLLNEKDGEIQYSTSSSIWSEIYE